MASKKLPRTRCGYRFHPLFIGELESTSKRLGIGMAALLEALIHTSRDIRQEEANKMVMSSSMARRIYEFRVLSTKKD